MTTALEQALLYARAGYDVLPLFGIVEPAPPAIVEAFHAGKLTKKAAQAHARCACGQHPCKSPGKHPRTPNGVNGATRDERQIRLWFQHERAPTNMGIRLPPEEMALDFDFYVAGVRERFAQLRAQGMPDTLTQDSGGGLHVLFRNKPGFDYGSTLGGATGVDIIHHGQRYLVAAPSTHWTGGRYQWANDADPELVPAFIEREARRGARGFATPKTPKPKAASSKPEVDRGLVQPLEVEDALEWAITLAADRLEPAIADGEEGSEEHGHVTLARAACHLIGGCMLDPEQALEILWEEYNPRCVPPWGEDEYEDFERCVLGAGGGVEAPGYLLTSDAVRELAADAEKRKAARDAVKPRKRELPDEPAPDYPFPLLGRVIDLRSKPKRFEYLVEGLPFAGGGKVNAIQGAPNAGKSPFALLFALSVATGEAFLGRGVLHKGPVLYLDGETGQLAHMRMIRLCNALGVEPPSPEDVEFRDVETSFSVEYAEALEAHLRASPKRLVIIDTYGALLPADIDNNSSQFAHWLRMLGRLSRAVDVVIVVLIHDKKGGTQDKVPALEMAAGNYQAAGAFQGSIRLHRSTQGTPTNDDPITVSCARSPERDFKPFAVQWSDVPAPKQRTSERVLDPDSDPELWGLIAKVVPLPEGKAEARDAALEERRSREEHLRRQEILNHLAGLAELGETEASQRRVRGDVTGKPEAVKNSLLALASAGVLQVTKGRQGDLYGLAPYSKKRQEALMKLNLSLPGKEK